MWRTEHRPSDRGYTLIELLIVIVLLGILTTVVVFSVRGIVDRGKESTANIDEREIVTAMEAYYARYGVYTDEQGLVDEGMLRQVSSRHDVAVAADGESYTLTTVPLP